MVTGVAIGYIHLKQITRLSNKQTFLETAKHNSHLTTINLKKNYLFLNKIEAFNQIGNHSSTDFIYETLQLVLNFITILVIFFYIKLCFFKLKSKDLSPKT